MTKLTYKVGAVEVNSYDEALKMRERTKEPIQRIYTEVAEESKVDPAKREKRLAAIRKKAAEQRAH